MKINNKLGLPDFIVEALINSDYTRIDKENSISTTQLIGSPYVRLLQKLHANEIVEDASDRMWSMLGQIGHGIAARSAGKFPELIIEKRFEQEMTFINGKGKEATMTVDGQIDCFDTRDGILYDNKFTSHWSVVYSPVGKIEWHEQLNVYAWLLRKHGYDVKGIKVIAWLRDLTKIEKLKHDKPSDDIVIIPLPVWTMEQAEEFVFNKLRYHTTGDISECTFDERWAKKPRYAVKKFGASRATKLYDSMDDAYANLKNGYQVEYRPGSDGKCDHYCNVNKFCTYYRNKNSE